MCDFTYVHHFKNGGHVIFSCSSYCNRHFIPIFNKFIEIKLNFNQNICAVLIITDAALKKVGE